MKITLERDRDRDRQRDTERDRERGRDRERQREQPEINRYKRREWHGMKHIYSKRYTSYIYNYVGHGWRIG